MDSKSTAVRNQNQTLKPSDKRNIKYKIDKVIDISSKTKNQPILKHLLAYPDSNESRNALKAKRRHKDQNLLDILTNKIQFYACETKFRFPETPDIQFKKETTVIKQVRAAVEFLYQAELLRQFPDKFTRYRNQELADQYYYDQNILYKYLNNQKARLGTPELLGYTSSQVQNNYKFVEYINKINTILQLPQIKPLNPNNQSFKIQNKLINPNNQSFNIQNNKPKFKHTNNTNQSFKTQNKSKFEPTITTNQSLNIQLDQPKFEPTNKNQSLNLQYNKLKFKNTEQKIMQKPQNKLDRNDKNDQKIHRNNNRLFLNNLIDSNTNEYNTSMNTYNKQRSERYNTNSRYSSNINYSNYNNKDNIYSNIPKKPPELQQSTYLEKAKSKSRSKSNSRRSTPRVKYRNITHKKVHYKKKVNKPEQLSNDYNNIQNNPTRNKHSSNKYAEQNNHVTKMTNTKTKNNKIDLMSLNINSSNEEKTNKPKTNKSNPPNDINAINTNTSTTRITNNIAIQPKNNDNQKELTQIQKQNLSNYYQNIKLNQENKENKNKNQTNQILSNLHKTNKIHNTPNKNNQNILKNNLNHNNIINDNKANKQKSITPITQALSQPPQFTTNADPNNISIYSNKTNTTNKSVSKALTPQINSYTTQSKTISERLNNEMNTLLLKYIKPKTNINQSRQEIHKQKTKEKQKEEKTPETNPSSYQSTYKIPIDSMNKQNEMKQNEKIINQIINTYDPNETKEEITINDSINDSYEYIRLGPYKSDKYQPSPDTSHPNTPEPTPPIIQPLFYTTENKTIPVKPSQINVVNDAYIQDIDNITDQEIQFINRTFIKQNEIINKSIDIMQQYIYIIQQRANNKHPQITSISQYIAKYYQIQCDNQTKYRDILDQYNNQQFLLKQRQMEQKHIQEIKQAQQEREKYQEEKQMLNDNNEILQNQIQEMTTKMNNLSLNSNTASVRPPRYMNRYNHKPYEQKPRLQSTVIIDDNDSINSDNSDDSDKENNNNNNNQSNSYQPFPDLPYKESNANKIKDELNQPSNEQFREYLHSNEGQRNSHTSANMEDLYDIKSEYKRSQKINEAYSIENNIKMENENQKERATAQNNKINQDNTNLEWRQNRQRNSNNEDNKSHISQNSRKSNRSNSTNHTRNNSNYRYNANNNANNNRYYGNYSQNRYPYNQYNYPIYNNNNNQYQYTDYNNNRNPYNNNYKRNSNNDNNGNHNNNNNQNNQNNTDYISNNNNNDQNPRDNNNNNNNNNSDDQSNQNNNQYTRRSQSYNSSRTNSTRPGYTTKGKPISPKKEALKEQIKQVAKTEITIANEALNFTFKGTDEGKHHIQTARCEQTIERIKIWYQTAGIKIGEIMSCKWITNKVFRDECATTYLYEVQNKQLQFHEVAQIVKWLREKYGNPLQYIYAKQQLERWKISQEDILYKPHQIMQKAEQKFKKYEEILKLAPLTKEIKEAHSYKDYDKFTYLKTRLGNDIFKRFRQLDRPYRKPENLTQLGESLNKLYEAQFYDKIHSLDHTRNQFRDPTHTESAININLITPITHKYKSNKSNNTYNYSNNRGRSRSRSTTRSQYSNYSNKSNYKYNNNNRKYNNNDRYNSPYNRSKSRSNSINQYKYKSRYNNNKYNHNRSRTPNKRYNKYDKYKTKRYPSKSPYRNSRSKYKTKNNHRSKYNKSNSRTRYKTKYKTKRKSKYQKFNKYKKPGRCHKCGSSKHTHKRCRASRRRIESYRKYKKKQYRNKRIYQIEENSSDNQSTPTSSDSEKEQTPNSQSSQIYDQTPPSQSQNSTENSAVSSSPTTKHNTFQQNSEILNKDNLAEAPRVNIIEQIHPIDIQPIPQHRNIIDSPESIVSDKLQINLLTIFDNQYDSDSQSDKENQNPAIVRMNNNNNNETPMNNNNNNNSSNNTIPSNQSSFRKELNSRSIIQQSVPQTRNEKQATINRLNNEGYKSQPLKGTKYLNPKPITTATILKDKEIEEKQQIFEDEIRRQLKLRSTTTSTNQSPNANNNTRDPRKYNNNNNNLSNTENSKQNKNPSANNNNKSTQYTRKSKKVRSEIIQIQEGYEDHIAETIKSSVSRRSRTREIKREHSEESSDDQYININHDDNSQYQDQHYMNNPRYIHYDKETQKKLDNLMTRRIDFQIHKYYSKEYPNPITYITHQHQTERDRLIHIYFIQHNLDGTQEFKCNKNTWLKQNVDPVQIDEQQNKEIEYKTYFVSDKFINEAESINPNTPIPIRIPIYDTPVNVRRKIDTNILKYNQIINDPYMLSPYINGQWKYETNRIIEDQFKYSYTVALSKLIHDTNRHQYNMIQYTYDNHSVPQVIDNEFYELVNNNQYIRHFVICHPHSDPMAESNKYYFIQQITINKHNAYKQQHIDILNKEATTRHGELVKFYHREYDQMPIEKDKEGSTYKIKNIQFNIILPKGKYKKIEYEQILRQMDTNPAAKIDILTQSVKELNINQLYADQFQSKPSSNADERDNDSNNPIPQVFMLNPAKSNTNSSISTTTKSNKRKSNELDQCDETQEPKQKKRRTTNNSQINSAPHKQQRFNPTNQPQAPKKIQKHTSIQIEKSMTSSISTADPISSDNDNNILVNSTRLAPSADQEANRTKLQQNLQSQFNDNLTVVTNNKARKSNEFKESINEYNNNNKYISNNGNESEDYSTITSEEPYPRPFRNIVDWNPRNKTKQNNNNNNINSNENNNNENQKRKKKRERRNSCREDELIKYHTDDEDDSDTSNSDNEYESNESGPPRISEDENDLSEKEKQRRAKNAKRQKKQQQKKEERQQRIRELRPKKAVVIIKEPKLIRISSEVSDTHRLLTSKQRKEEITRYERERKNLTEEEKERDLKIKYDIFQIGHGEVLIDKLIQLHNHNPWEYTADNDSENDNPITNALRNIHELKENIKLIAEKYPMQLYLCPTNKTITIINPDISEDEEKSVVYNETQNEKQGESTTEVNDWEEKDEKAVHNSNEMNQLQNQLDDLQVRYTDIFNHQSPMRSNIHSINILNSINNQNKSNEIIHESIISDKKAKPMNKSQYIPIYISDKAYISHNIPDQTTYIHYNLHNRNQPEIIINNIPEPNQLPISTYQILQNTPTITWNKHNEMYSFNLKYTMTNNKVKYNNNNKVYQSTRNNNNNYKSTKNDNNHERYQTSQLRDRSKQYMVRGAFNISNTNYSSNNNSIEQQQQLQQQLKRKINHKTRKKKRDVKKQCENAKPKTSQQAQKSKCHQSKPKTRKKNYWNKHVRPKTKQQYQLKNTKIVKNAKIKHVTRNKLKYKTKFELPLNSINTISFIKDNRNMILYKPSKNNKSTKYYHKYPRYKNNNYKAHNVAKCYTTTQYSYNDYYNRNKKKARMNRKKRKKRNQQRQKARRKNKKKNTYLASQLKPDESNYLYSTINMISDFVIYDLDKFTQLNDNNNKHIDKSNEEMNKSSINQINNAENQSKRKGTAHESDSKSNHKYKYYNKYHKKIKSEKIEDTIATNSTYWYIKAWIIINNETNRLINLMADTGATICAINTAVAKQFYQQKIHTLKRPKDVLTAGKKTLKIDKYIDFSFIHPKTQELITTISFYLIDNLTTSYLASHYLLRKLGYIFPSIPPKYKNKLEHIPERDTQFGTCNNWDQDRLRIPLHQNRSESNTNKTNEKRENHTKTQNSKHNTLSNQYKYKSKHIPKQLQCYRIINEENEPELPPMTPYNEYLTLCRSGKPLPKLEAINNITFIKSKNKIYNHISNTNFEIHYLNTENIIEINHISNFKASKAEIEEAKKLTKDIPLKDIPLDHLYPDSANLANKFIKLKKSLPKLFATYQSQHRVIPKYEFKIDLIDEAKGQPIFKPQYPLNEKKRLVYMYTALKNIENGLFIPDYKSPHNVPALIIQRKDGRYRCAYDFTKLNSKTKTVQSHIPTYNYLFEKLRGRGYYSCTDAKNFFEGIQLRVKDRPLSHNTSPIGQFNMTRGTYGYKNISAIAQDIINATIRHIPNAGAFIDDIFIKHAPNATDEEIYNDIHKLCTAADKTGLLLHPEKTFIKVEQIEFVGYLFTQEGTIPRKKYIEKVLKFKRPTSKKEIQSYLGLVQYIARYLHKLAEWSYVLNKLTKADCKAKWGKEQDHAFDQIQKQVSNIKLLSHPTDNDVFLVQTDASKYAISGVLYQRQWTPKYNKHTWRLIEFYSKQSTNH